MQTICVYTIVMNEENTQDQKLTQVTTTLIHVARAYNSAANKLSAQFGLSQATSWPAVIIGRQGEEGVRPGALATILGLDASSVVRVIDHLIEKGLVERQDDPLDRRAKILHLTADGKQRVGQIEKALIPFRREMLAKASAEDIDACLRVMDILHSSIVANEAAVK